MQFNQITISKKYLIEVKASSKNYEIYHMYEVLNKATEACTVPINGTVGIYIIFKILSTQTATNSSHDASLDLFLSLKNLHRDSPISATKTDVPRLWDWKEILGTINKLGCNNRKLREDPKLEEVIVPLRTSTLSLLYPRS